VSRSRSSLWLEGARLRTLPISVAPVVTGTAAAAAVGAQVWWKAALCLVLALLLQVGINFANDYSDGIRGTDDNRVGPQRLVGSGAVPPGRVRAVASGCFTAAAVIGVVLSAVSSWWLVLLGAASIAAAWFYTGGPRPYGYLGLGEVFVFVFFGLVATLGTTFVQAGRTTGAALAGSCTVGLLACAVLVANNLRDLRTDRQAGKRTLAVRVGDRATRVTFLAMVVLAYLLLTVFAAGTTWWALLGLLGAALLPGAASAVAHGADGMALLPALKLTGLASLTTSLLVLASVLVTR
jgi:1,4-dihydroxy-2-naphthoate polyprenyltransferase